MRGFGKNGCEGYVALGSMSSRQGRKRRREKMMCRKGQEERCAERSIRKEKPCRRGRRGETVGGAAGEIQQEGF